VTRVVEAAPYLQCSLLCDDVGRTSDGKLIIHGVFEAILSAEFPATHRSFYVCNRWTGGSGAHREKIRVLSPDGQHTVLEGPETNFELESRSSCHTVICRLDGLKFPEPGTYWVQVLLDGRMACEYALSAGSLPPRGTDEARGRGAGPKKGRVQD
jgi:hypothetical protein